MSFNDHEEPTKDDVIEIEIVSCVAVTYWYHGKIGQKHLVADARTFFYDRGQQVHEDDWVIVTKCDEGDGYECGKPLAKIDCRIISSSKATTAYDNAMSII